MARKNRNRFNDKQSEVVAKVPMAARIFATLNAIRGPGLLMLLSIVLLTLAFAPFGQFYLAWVGLVPWFRVIRSAPSPRRAFFWGWASGTVFFTVNMWWMASVTVLGMLALMLYCGLYWGLAALILRGCRLLPPSASSLHRSSFTVRRSAFLVLSVPAVWVGVEWLRGIIVTGLPWLYMGHTQTPFLAMCQIADLTGVYGVSFWVVAINALVFSLLPTNANRRAAVSAAGVVAMLCLVVLGYGRFRLAQHTTSPGITVCVVQSNFPQDNTGQKGAEPSVILKTHVDLTQQALDSRRDVDLAAWSETMMPVLNQRLRVIRLPSDGGGSEIVNYRSGDAKLACAALTSLARRNGVSVLVGGSYAGQAVQVAADKFDLVDRRNSAYLFTSDGQLSAIRYDKIHLVPFGEFLPFKDTLPWLYHVLLALSPYDHDYNCTPGEALTVFTIPAGNPSVQSARIVTPICFEDLDATLVARMFRPDQDDRKRADLLVNLTNDGWFRFNEMPQHLQAAIFRSIENRVPTARSVNTGISGFVDSNGHAFGLIRAGTEGAAIAQVHFDSRLTFYTRWGDVFAIMATLATAIISAGALLRRWFFKIPNPGAGS